MSQLSPSLELVYEVAREFRATSDAYGEAVIQYERDLARLKEKLDAAVVSAVDWGGEAPTAVARVAGYKSHAAIRDARRRVDARSTEVR